MKHALLALAFGVLILAVACNKQNSDTASSSTAPATLSSFDQPTPGAKLLTAQTIKLENSDLAQVAKLYAQISGRSVLRAENLPNEKITFSNQGPMTPVEVLRALDTALAVRHIAAVLQGTQYVKFVSENDACKEGSPLINLPPDQLPDSRSFLIYVYKPKKNLGNKAITSLAPFASLPQSIVYIPGGNRPFPGNPPGIPQQVWDKLSEKDDVIILRDYSSNVKSMLKVLATLEQ